MVTPDPVVLIQRTYELFNLNRLDGEFIPVTEDFRFVNIPLKQTLGGLRSYTEFLKQIRRWSNHLTIDIAHQVVAVGEVFNMLAIRKTRPGWPTCPCQASPRGSSFEYFVPEVWSFRDGLVACIYTYCDLPDVAEPTRMKGETDVFQFPSRLKELATSTA